MAITPQHVARIALGGYAFDVECCLGTGILYREEFWGRLDPPYKGSLADDLLAIYNGAQPTVRDAESGKEVDNPDYRGQDVEALLRVAWAMARSVDPEFGGPTKLAWPEFRAECMSQPVSVYEEAQLYETVVMRLGGGVTFRRPEGPAPVGEADEEEAAAAEG